MFRFYNYALAGTAHSHEGTVFEEMKGRFAVITGATSGIGRASSILLAQQGIKVVLAGRNEQSGKALVWRTSNFCSDRCFRCRIS